MIWHISNLNISPPSGTTQYSPFGVGSFQNNTPRDYIEVECTISITSYEYDNMTSIENFENALRNDRYPFLTNQELDDLVFEKYPEHFL